MIYLFVFCIGYFKFGMQACVEILHILHRRVTRRGGVNLSFYSLTKTRRAEKL